MKTEMQIIEQFKFENQSAQQLDQWKKQQQALHQQPPQQMSHHQDVQQVNVQATEFVQILTSKTTFFFS